MTNRIFYWLNKRYPQNILIKNPLVGSLIYFTFCILFTLIYRPLDVHQARNFNLGMTVAIYFIIVAIALFGIVKLLKLIRYFSDPDEWTILKEVLSIVISLTISGISIYLTGFLMENPEKRWNLATFFNSFLISFLVGIIPFMFFTLINYRYLFVTDIIKFYNTGNNRLSPEMTEELVRIGSQLKKEELEFYPSQLLYAESDGNYIVFHLNICNQIKKRIIRNTISNIEQQLSEIPFLFRTHRAFIVNVRKVSSQKGNTLGYRIKLSGIDTEIPVSRQKARDFDQIMKQYE
jgi:LytTr DNA-binding domain